MKREEPRVRFGRIYFEAAGFFCVGRGGVGSKTQHKNICKSAGVRISISHFADLLFSAIVTGSQMIAAYTQHDNERNRDAAHDESVTFHGTTPARAPIFREPSHP